MSTGQAPEMNASRHLPDFAGLFAALLFERCRLDDMVCRNPSDCLGMHRNPQDTLRILTNPEETFGTLGDPSHSLTLRIV